MMKKYWALGLVLVLTGSSCQQGTPSENKPPADDDRWVQLSLPSVSADSLYEFVKRQVSYGVRVPGSGGHQRCGDYLVAALRGHGLQVLEQKATVALGSAPVPVRNIIAQFHPERTERVLISAHWDTRPQADQDPDPTRRGQPILGANDGASGVAVLLELASLLKQKDPGLGVDLICWDTEDMGTSDLEHSYCLGSQHWCQQPLPPGYRARWGINLDMVGARGAQFPQEGYSRRYAGKLVRRVWQAARRLGHAQLFPTTHAPEILDDHYYLNTRAKLPTLDIIHLNPTDGTFFQQWHTQDDNLAIIDPQTLQAVTQVVAEMVYQEGHLVSPAAAAATAPAP